MRRPTHAAPLGPEEGGDVGSWGRLWMDRASHAGMTWVGGGMGDGMDGWIGDILAVEVNAAADASGDLGGRVDNDVPHLGDN